MAGSNTWIITIFLTGLLYAYSVSYNETEFVVMCPPHDSCSKNRTLEDDNLLYQTCECKRSCTRYDTCCQDSPYNSLHNRKFTSSDSSLQETCQLLMRAENAIFAITKCRRNWRHGRRVKYLCESNKQNLSDPISILPVSNAKLRITYKNFFCAMCNNDTDNLVFWNIKFVNPFNLLDTPNDTYENIYEKDQLIQFIYNKTVDEWGIVISGRNRADQFPVMFKDEANDPWMTMHHPREWTMDDGNTFRPIYFIFTVPSHLNDSITICEPRLVSECHPNWRDKRIENKCRSYMGMIYGWPTKLAETFERYRNVYCAICNFAYGFYCEEPIRTLTKEGETTLTFALILDINPGDGNRVGRIINRCGPNQKYNKHLRKCLRTGCIKRGYKRKNGKCVAG